MSKKKITEFTPLQNNPNAHTERGYEALEKSIGELGYTEPMVASSDGVILSGNARYEKAGAMLTGEPIIVESDGTRPVIHVRTDVKGDSPQARRIVYASNRVAELDFALDVDVLLRDVQAGVDFSGLYTEGELEALLSDLMPDETPEDPGAQVDRADELRQKWQTERGQVWQVGRHRVMCGDSTSAEDVARLMGESKPSLMVTDPPYGVDYDPAWRNEAAEKGYIAFASGREGVVQNDDRVDWSAAWALSPCDVAYCWHAGLHASEVQRSLEGAGYEMRSQIIWAKPRFVISRGHYHWQHEPCWYAVRKGKTASWIGDHSQTTLWEIPMLDDTDMKTHGTQKPTECMARPIRNHEGDVYDPFLGSGTTLAACEQTNRTGYGMEIDPGYVAVILERLAGMGLEPKLVSDPMDH